MCFEYWSVFRLPHDYVIVIFDYFGVHGFFVIRDVDISVINGIVPEDYQGVLYPTKSFIFLLLSALGDMWSRIILILGGDSLCLEVNIYLHFLFLYWPAAGEEEGLGEVGYLLGWDL